MNQPLQEVENDEEPEVVAMPTSVPDDSAINLRLLIVVLEFIRDQSRSSAMFVEEQAVHICSEFKELARQTEAQGESIAEVIDVARNIELEGEVIPYEKSVEILYEPLAEAISNILQVSKLAMSMVMMIGNAADNITQVESCIDQVQKLTRQTNMLAMNTQIEAARAGEAGKSFRIIAQEVKGLSESIKSISEQIQDEVAQVSSSVKESSKMIDSLANYDMTENLTLKTRIDGLIESIMEQNNRFTQLLEDSAAAAQRTATSIGGLVVGIQFQDRNSQTTGDLCTLIDYVIHDLKRLENQQFVRDLQPAETAEGDVEELVKGLKLSEVRNNTLQALYDKGELKQESSLYQTYLVPKEKPSSNSVSELFGDDDDEDDIELF